MKKIIATVLAMVMALALCVTAFAATTTAKKAYDNKGKELTGTYEYELKKAQSSKKADNGTIKHYVVNGDTYYVAADSSSYDLKLTSDGKAPLYLAEIDTYAYEYKATEYKAIGEKCGQLDLDEGVKGYVVETVAGKTLYFEGDKDNGTVALLVNGEIVMATAATPVEHTWKASAFDKNGNATEYKCKTCATVAKVYETVEAAEKAGMTETDVVDGNLIGWNYKVPGAATTGSANSPKTFDAGIAMYAGMALMSVAGSAVVIGKKKEF